MAAPNGNTLRERISFDPNVTQTITIAAKGTEQLARDGSTEWRYFLTDNKIMWVPDTVHLQMLAAHADLPATFEITKTKTGKAAATWEVIHVQDEPPAAAEEAAARQPLLHGPPASAPPASQQPAVRPAAPPAAVRPAAPPAATDPNTAYTAAFRTALKCAQAAARLHGVGAPFTFTTADLLTIAAAIYGGR